MLCAYRRRKSHQVVLGLYAARWVLVGVAIIALGFLLLAPPGTLRTPKNIAAGAAWRASSGQSPYSESAGTVPASASRDFFFHTNEEDSPWVEIELPGGRGGRLSGVKVVNRPNCCQARAVPLVLEVVDGRRKARKSELPDVTA